MADLMALIISFQNSSKTRQYARVLNILLTNHHESPQKHSTEYNHAHQQRKTIGTLAHRDTLAPPFSVKSVRIWVNKSSNFHHIYSRRCSDVTPSPPSDREEHVISFVDSVNRHTLLAVMRCSDSKISSTVGTWSQFSNNTIKVCM